MNTERSAELGVSVVIATHGRPRLLERLFTSLRCPANLEVLRDGSWEVLVVENGPPAGARAVCEEGRGFQARYAHVSEIGKSGALNYALDHARGDFICFFDDDVRLGEHVLEAYRSAAVRYGAGHFFGGPVHAEREIEPPAWLVEYLPTSVLGWSLGAEERYHDAPDFHGANWGAFVADMRSAGGFASYLGPTPRYRALDEELELQERMLAAGQRAVYVPAAEVWHHVPREMCTLGWARRREYQQELSRALQGQFEVNRPQIAGAPRWLYRQCVSETVRWLAARARPPADRVRQEMRCARCCGRLIGQILHRRLEATDGK